MYNGIKKIEDVIDYIETYITKELDCNILALRMQLSVYEFRRIFSFVVGDYILTQYDMEEKPHYDDVTAMITWGIDIHYPEPINEKSLERHSALLIADFSVPCRSNTADFFK